jgi:lambda family phage tail tape measure protein
MANMIARLGVVLGLDSAEFNKGLEEAGRKLEQFGEAAEKFGRMGVVAMVAAGAAALKYADEIADVAAANDLAIASVLKLSDALANNGGKADDAGKMLASFSKFIDTAASGSFEAQKTAKMLGISFQDLGRLSQEELLNKAAKGLSTLDDTLTRNAKGFEVFGKSFKTVDVVGFAEDMSQANKAADEQAIAIQAAADAYDKLGQNARNSMVIVASSIGPTLNSFLDYLKQLNGESNDFGKAFKVVFQTVAIVAANVLYIVKGILGEIVAIGNFADNLITKNLATAIAENEKYVKKTIQDRAALADFYDKVMSPDEETPKNKPQSQSGRTTVLGKDKEKEAALRERMRLDAQAAREMERYLEEEERKRLKTIYDLNQEQKKYSKTLFDIEGQEVAAYTNEAKRIEAAQRQLEIQNELLNISQLTKDMRSEDAQLAKDLYLNEQRRLDAEKEINRNNLLDADAKKELIARQNELAKATEDYLNAQNKAIKAQREGTFQDGFGKQAAKFLRDMPTELEMGAKAFDSLMGNMESAIDRFVRTGKLSFKDLARSIIQDLIAMQMKAMATSFFSTIFSTPVGPTMDAGALPSSFDQYKPRADGGSVSSNSTYLVGERGPELFVPSGSGTIIPNHSMSSMGGTTNVTNNYINAIDTKSFEERLLGSSTAIWAANKYGEKSLATSYGRT